MISWFWALVTFFVGFWIGFWIVALFDAGDIDER